jgi:hypothetical protein
MFAGRLRFLRRAACVVATALSLVPTPGVAMRVNDVQRFATLDRAAQGRLSAGPCKGPAGSTVEMIAEVAGPGVQAGASRFWFVRVVDGDCAGAEFSILQNSCATSAIHRNWRDHRAEGQPLTMRSSENGDALGRPSDM